MQDPTYVNSSQHTELFRKSQGQESSNFASTIKLNNHKMVRDTPPTEGPSKRHSFEEGAKRFVMGRSSSQADGLPSVMHGRKQ